MLADLTEALCYGSIGAAFVVIAVLWFLSGFLEDTDND